MTNLDPNCGGAVPVPNPTQPTTFPANFPDEFFYMDADAANLTTGAGEKVLAQFGVEGAFGGTGATADGQQTVFSRIRFKHRHRPRPGHDVQDHASVRRRRREERPDAPASPNLFVTQDVGVTPGAFSEVLSGPRRPVPEVGRVRPDARQRRTAGWLPG